MQISTFNDSGDIAIDDDDAVHICYGDDQYDLLYATNASGSWSFTTIDTTYMRGGCSLTVDTDGYAHIVYLSYISGYEFSYATNVTGTWGIETIDTVDVYRSVPSEHDVQVTSAGDVHVSYYDDTNGDLKYALRSYSTSLWTTTTLDSSGDVGQANSLVVVGSSVYVAYTDSTNSDIKLATYDGSTWTLTTVTSTFSVNQYSALAEDGNGNLFLAFQIGGNSISYNVFEISSSTWSNEVASVNGAIGHYIDIAVDDFDNVYFVWVDETNTKVNMTTNAVADSYSTWEEVSVSGSFLLPQNDADVAVDSFGKVHIFFPDDDKDIFYYYQNTDGDHYSPTGNASYSSVATDDDGHVYVAYYDTLYGFAGFLTYDSGSGWTSETIDIRSGSDVGQYISLVVEDDGSEYHVSYYDASSADLMYAHKTSSASSWTVETVVSAGAVGQYSALFVDASGYAHISYYDATNGDLKYATNNTGSWTTTTVDGVGDVGKYTTSIAVTESTGRRHICYLDNTNSKLKYAYKDPGSAWSRATIDASVRGLYCDITASSSSNVAYISYYDPSSYDLKYARVSASSGVVSVAKQTVDSTGNVGGYTSIALDSFGRRFITYYDFTNDDLKIARMDTLGNWDIRTLGDSVGIGTYTSLAFDAHGHAQITSVDSATNQLYHTYY